MKCALLLLFASVLFAAVAKADEIDEIKAQILKLQERVQQLEAERKAEREAQREAEREAQREAEREAKREAQREAKRKAEREAKQKAEREAGPIDGHKASKKPRKKPKETDLAEDDTGKKTPKPLNVFGKSVKLTFYGTLQADVMHDFQALGGDEFVNEFITGDIPVKGSKTSPPDNRTGFSVNQSNVNIGLEAPTGYGAFRLFTEINFEKYTTGGPAFELYQAYGALGPLLAGKAWSTFSNIDSQPDTLDFEGPNAIPEVQQVMLRWTQPLPNDLSFLFALEEPNADLTLPAGASAINSIPDMIACLEYKPSWANIQASGLYRRLQGKGDGFDSAVNGWGLQLSGNMDTFGRDSFQLGAVYGRGIGHYIQDTQGYGLDAAPSSPGSSSLEAIPAFGGWVGYQHWWAEALSSSASFGYVRLWNTDGQAADVYRNTTYISANIIWSPWRPVDVGLEYLYGQRRTKSAGSGYNNRLQFSVKFNFGS